MIGITTTLEAIAELLREEGFGVEIAKEILFEPNSFYYLTIKYSHSDGAYQCCAEAHQDKLMVFNCPTLGSIDLRTKQRYFHLGDPDVFKKTAQFIKRIYDL